MRKRGRPFGYKLSAASRRAISESKKGQRHSQATKDKISRTLTLYFRKLRPLSEEIINRYCRIDDDDLCGWINNIRDELDCSENILTDRNLISSTKIELAYGDEIEFFSHSLTPEALLLLKEHCRVLGINIDDYI